MELLISWPRFKRIATTAIAVVIAVLIINHFIIEGNLTLDAKGLVTKDQVSVSALFEARVTNIYVRPGDFVKKGDSIAVIESPFFTKSLAEITNEISKLIDRISHLQSRLVMLEAILPLANSNAHSAKMFEQRVANAQTSGVIGGKYAFDIKLSTFTAENNYLTLKAERDSIPAELTALVKAERELEEAYAALQQSYAGGLLTAPVDGVIGSSVAHVGQVVTGTNYQITNIYTGSNYVLAYLPQYLLVPIAEEQDIRVASGDITIHGRVHSILAITDAMPNEYQKPNMMRERGQIVRVSLSTDRFPLGAKVSVTTCYIFSCGNEH